MLSLIDDKVCIVPIFDPETTPGGIIIPEMAKERCDQGIVKYIGPKCKSVKIGDYVFFSGYSGTLMKIEGEGLFIIMKEDGVLAKYELDVRVSIPGLYFRFDHDEYQMATIESALPLIAQAMTDYKVALNIKSEMPRVEDYNK